MVSEHSRPGAAWGKHKPPPADGGDGYGLLFCSADFPKEGEEALLLLAKSVQWQADSSEAPLRPSFAIWPVGTRENGVLAVRLLDSGRDSFGRARTMRIEAAWFDVREPRDAVTIAARYLAPSGWPAEPWSDVADIRLATDAPADDRASFPVSRFIDKHRRVPRFLVPGHSSYIAEAFDAIDDQDGAVTLCDARGRGLPKSGPLPPREAATSVGPARTRRHGQMFFTVLIAAMAAAIGFAAGIRRERAGADAARSAAEEAAKTAERQRRELNDLTGRLKSVGGGIRELEKLRSENEKLRAERKEFADDLRALLDSRDQGQGRTATDVEILDGQ